MNSYVQSISKAFLWQAIPFKIQLPTYFAQVDLKALGDPSSSRLGDAQVGLETLKSAWRRSSRLGDAQVGLETLKSAWRRSSRLGDAQAGLETLKPAWRCSSRLKESRSSRLGDPQAGLKNLAQVGLDTLKRTSVKSTWRRSSRLREPFVRSSRFGTQTDLEFPEWENGIGLAI